jgi:subtilisin family serine protease
VGIDPINQALSFPNDVRLAVLKDAAASSFKNLRGSAGHLMMPKDVASAESPQPRALNSVAVIALQSGSTGSAPLWAIGVNGTGQYVQVTDTGFDDASCFLRDFGSAASLTGGFNADYQVTRSLWNNPITDFTKRKVVQYISVSLGGTYEYDYASGHGTHCVGTVAGSIASSDDDTALSPSADYYTNCAVYTSYCASWFCPTCGDDANRCDTTCGFANSASASDFQGMAPGAKIMAYDFGDGSGNLDVPDIEALYPVAYAEGH